MAELLQNTKFFNSQPRLEKTLESPLDCMEIKPVNPKRNQPWIFIGKTYAEAEAPIFWPPDAKSWLLREYPMPGKIKGKRRMGRQTMGWSREHHPLNWHEYEQLQEIVEDRGAWGAIVHSVSKSYTSFSNWTTTTISSTHKMTVTSQLPILKIKTVTINDQKSPGSKIASSWELL